MARYFVTTLVAFLAALLSACGIFYPKVEMPQMGAVTPAVRETVLPNNGSIFQANQYRPLFEDHRARLVGDTLVVQIVEKVSASQKSTSSIDKSGKLAGSVAALPGVRPAALASPRNASTPCL